MSNDAQFDTQQGSLWPIDICAPPGFDDPSVVLGQAATALAERTGGLVTLSAHVAKNRDGIRVSLRAAGIPTHGNICLFVLEYIDPPKPYPLTIDGIGVTNVANAEELRKTLRTLFATIFVRRSLADLLLTARTVYNISSCRELNPIEAAVLAVIAQRDRPTAEEVFASIDGGWKETRRSLRTLQRAGRIVPIFERGVRRWRLPDAL